MQEISGKFTLKKNIPELELESHCLHAYICKLVWIMREILSRTIQANSRKQCWMFMTENTNHSCNTYANLKTCLETI